MNENFIVGAQQTWATILTFLPKFGMFLVILLVGYFLSDWISALFGRLLEKLGFNRLVERGGIKRVLDRTNHDASDILCKVVFYTLFLFVLQLAFGVFGPNPINDILTRAIAFLPNLFVALIIVVIAAAVARVVRETVEVSLGTLSYGRFVARMCSVVVVIVGVFAALSHLNIAPAIVNGIFYAALAVVAGSLIIAIGGGGILPMRRQWEKAITQIENEAPKLKAAVQQPASAKTETAEETANRLAARPATTVIPQVPRYEPKERSRP